MLLLQRLLGFSCLVACQFAAGHLLGFGTGSLVANEFAATIAIAFGNAIGVTAAAMATARLFGLQPVPATMRALAAALIGSLAGLFLISLIASSYTALLLPLLLAILAFHVATRGVLIMAKPRLVMTICLTTLLLPACTDRDPLVPPPAARPTQADSL